MTRTLVRPAEIRASAQLALGRFETAQLMEGVAGDVLYRKTFKHGSDVLEESRSQLAAFVIHRERLTSSEAKVPAEFASYVENILCEILLGFMTRGAIFEALEVALSGNVVSGNVAKATHDVEYTTPTVRKYSELDGEHQFMTEMVRLLDDGLRRYYLHPHTAAYRVLLRDSVERFLKANALTRAADDFAPQLDFDPWTIDADLLFEVDVEPVREIIRTTLRHNAQTAMQFVRSFPRSVLSGYRDAGVIPKMTVAELRTWFATASPILATAALVPNKRSPVTPLCNVQDEEITGFSWPTPLSANRSGHSNCPAASSFEGFSLQQKRTVVRVRSGDRLMEGSDQSLHNGESMSTAEALLRVSAFAAMEMWCEQFEAYELCPELRDSLR